MNGDKKLTGMEFLNFLMASNKLNNKTAVEFEIVGDIEEDFWETETINSCHIDFLRDLMDRIYKIPLTHGFDGTEIDKLRHIVEILKGEQHD